MKHLLIKTQYNWADEIDFPGWTIMTEEEFEDGKKQIKEYLKNVGSFEIWVGTNEEIGFSSYEDIFGRNMKVLELSETDKEVIERLFGSSQGEITLDRILEHC